MKGFRMESQLTEKVELPNQCLGVNSGKRCTEMLPKGKHVCNRCKAKINSGGSKLSLKITSGNRCHKKPYPKDI
ncbi:MAG: hypothetical protein HY219_02775 [Candidatus Staskawiczbacteria bacterium]|nr:hypothetical protein [Candidatus Staskawiczbacteria bacterium]